MDHALDRFPWVDVNQSRPWPNAQTDPSNDLITDGTQASSTN